VVAVQTMELKIVSDRMVMVLCVLVMVVMSDQRTLGAKCEELRRRLDAMVRNVWHGLELQRVSRLVLLYYG